MTPTFIVLSWTLAMLLIESTTPFFFKNYFSVTYLLSSPELSCLGIPISVFACHGIKSIPPNFLYLMVCDRVESSLPSCLLFILMTLLAELEELGVGCYWNECTFSAKRSAPILNCNIAQSQFYQTKASCRP